MLHEKLELRDHVVCLSIYHGIYHGNVHKHRHAEADIEGPAKDFDLRPFLSILALVATSPSTKLRWAGTITTQERAESTPLPQVHKSPGSIDLEGSVSPWRFSYLYNNWVHQNRQAVFHNPSARPSEFPLLADMSGGTTGSMLVVQA